MRQQLNWPEVSNSKLQETKLILVLCCLYIANMDNTSFLTQTSIIHIFYQIFRKITTNTPKAKTKTYYPAFTRPKSPIPPSIVTNILELVSIFLPPQQTLLFHLEYKQTPAAQEGAHCPGACLMWCSEPRTGRIRTKQSSWKLCSRFGS